MNEVTAPKSEGLIQMDTGWFMDYIHQIQVVYMDGRVTENSFTHYLEAFCREIDSRPADSRIGVLYHLPSPSAVSSERRKRLSDALKSREAKLAATTDAYVMVTSSPIVSFALKAMYWVAPPAYPNTVTTSLLDGFKFIARYHECDKPAELADIYSKKLQETLPKLAPR